MPPFPLLIFFYALIIASFPLGIDDLRLISTVYTGTDAEIEALKHDDFEIQEMRVTLGHVHKNKLEYREKKIVCQEKSQALTGHGTLTIIWQD